jgi:hypothetical protein
MDKPKLRLKDQPQSTNASIDWLQNKYAQPKPPTALQRFVEDAKRIGRMLLLAAVVLAVFLAIPFRRWDDYSAWSHIQEALVHLEAQPDSLPNLKQVYIAAQSAGLLWDQPNGARPAKWYQRVQAERYDAAYGVAQVLAVGLVKNGNAPRGVRELSRLKERTGLTSLPDLPSSDQAIRACASCKSGKTEEKCPACAGKGGCARCDGQGSVTVPSPKSVPPLTAKLGGTGKASSREGKRLGDEALVVHHSCPKCKGSGKCAACAGAGLITTTCKACGGRVTIINFAADPSLFRDTLQGTIATVNNGMPLRRAIHIAAEAQRVFLNKSGALSNSALSWAQGDAVFTGTNPAASLSQPLQPNAFSEGASDIDLSGKTAGRGDAALGLPEARLQQACATLQREPLSVPGLTILAEVSRGPTNSPALRSRAMAAYALALLMQKNTSAFARAAQIQRATFPDLPPLLTITSEDYTATCDVCLGKGKKDMPCPSCMGPSTCETCKGTRKLATADGFVRCRDCELLEPCGMCKGQKKIVNATCPDCRGVGKIFKQSGNVRSNYNALLTDMAALCQETIDFAEQLNKARLGKTSDLRIQLL